MSSNATVVQKKADSNSIDVETIDRIIDRVLWIAVAIVHHANKARPNTTGVKVGGHQASSASMVSLMSVLWFCCLRRDDVVSVKPHASPVLHAINYLLGRLDRDFLTELRVLGGIQAYPSRIKDHDPVDFSTGSVGLGASVTIWSAISERYLESHFTNAANDQRARHIALIGDAELDEGACWEALIDPHVRDLGNVLWVVDWNRQSLDRVVPGDSQLRYAAMFEAAGWHVQRLEYGSKLETLFRKPGGRQLREFFESLPNTKRQRLMRIEGKELRKALNQVADTKVQAQFDRLDDDELHLTMRDFGGHDVKQLIEAINAADAVTDKPSVIFASTLKGWRLPTEGHPANHSALLSAQQYEQLAEKLGIDLGRDQWPTFESGSRESELCGQVAERLERERYELRPVENVPIEFKRGHSGKESTQQAFGRFFIDLLRESPQLAKRIVTVSPDVGTSTNLGGWINKVGVWAKEQVDNPFADDSDTLISWNEGPEGQHIELGIAEVNLVGLLGELGTTWSRKGEPLIPIGTLYDSFLARALEPWSFGIYGGGQSIIVGTPSGIALAPEGGAHQSTTTPSIGIEQPECVAWEPAFGQDLEWCLLHAIGQIGKPGGTSAYFRLSSRPLDSGLAALPEDLKQRQQRRDDVLAGGYLVQERDNANLCIVAQGVVIREAIEAATELEADGELAVNVVCLTSSDLIYRAVRARDGLDDADSSILKRLFSQPMPLVTVIDGHPHSLSYLAAVHGVKSVNLGVSDFGQSGNLDELFERYGIDCETIVGAALDAVEN